MQISFFHPIAAVLEKNEAHEAPDFRNSNEFSICSLLKKVFITGFNHLNPAIGSAAVELVC